MKGKSGGMNSAMKKMGRNLARAATQSGSAKAPMKFASGGAIKLKNDKMLGPKLPSAQDMGSMSGDGMDGSGFGAGRARGGKAATKGKKFSGTF